MKTISELLPEISLTESQISDMDERARVHLEKSREEDTKLLMAKGRALAMESGIPARHYNDIYLPERSVVSTHALAAVKERSDGGIWCLSGGVGCGKTLAASYWLLSKNGELIPETKISGLNIKLITAHEFGRTSRYENGGLKFVSCTIPDKLVIDDLGAEYNDAKGSFLSDLDELLDIRWKGEQETLITTNLHASVFKERYGNRIVDRIRHAGGWVNVSQDSMRRRE